MSRSKVIIFIVEGITDKDSLESILSELYEGKNIVFSIVGGDLTSDYRSQTINIDKKLVAYIKTAMDRDKFLKSDIDRVVHIVDTDGAFIDDSNIIYSDTNSYIYTPTNILTKDVNKGIERNKKKSQILTKLSSKRIIFTNIKYGVYYMSCNLEHVLHNIQNANDNQKKELAKQFEDKFFDNPSEFVKFISESDFAVAGNYEESWRYIKEDINSLNRYSNFHLFFKEE